MSKCVNCEKLVNDSSEGCHQCEEFTAMPPDEPDSGERNHVNFHDIDDDYGLAEAISELYKTPIRDIIANKRTSSQNKEHTYENLQRILACFDSPDVSENEIITLSSSNDTAVREPKVSSSNSTGIIKKLGAIIITPLAIFAGLALMFHGKYDTKGPP